MQQLVNIPMKKCMEVKKEKPSSLVSAPKQATEHFRKEGSCMIREAIYLCAPPGVSVGQKRPFTLSTTVCANLILLSTVQPAT